jgi:hypothetical protein
MTSQPRPGRRPSIPETGDTKQRNLLFAHRSTAHPTTGAAITRTSPSLKASENPLSEFVSVKARSWQRSGGLGTACSRGRRPPRSHGWEGWAEEGQSCRTWPFDAGRVWWRKGEPNSGTCPVQMLSCKAPNRGS